MKKYLIFDLDWTLLDSHWNNSKKIFNYIKENLPEYITKSENTLKNMYIFSNLKNILKDFLPEEEYKKHINWIIKALDKDIWKSKLFEWVAELIEKLSKEYKLYLSTWSPQYALEEILLNAWILKYFEITKWSNVIPKSIKHIEIFKDYSEDQDFEKYSVLIWDWDSDRNIAKESWIDFVRIWEKDLAWETSISRVVEIESILDKYHSKYNT